MTTRLTDEMVRVIDELQDYDPAFRKDQIQNPELELGTYLQRLEFNSLIPSVSAEPSVVAEPGDMLILTHNGPRSVTLPLRPVDSARITVKEAANSVQPITIASQGDDVFEEGSTEAIMTSPRASFAFVYFARIWYVI